MLESDGAHGRRRAVRVGGTIGVMAHGPGCKCLACSVAHVDGGAAAMAPRARFALECACGNNELARFGPFDDTNADELGLRWIFQCSRCGESLRLYQTSPAWRAQHRPAPVVGVAVTVPELE